MNQRNKPCRCQSGKKFKKCCGDEREAKAKQLEAIRMRAAEQKREQEERRKVTPLAFPYRRNPMAAALLFSAITLSMGGANIRIQP